MFDKPETKSESEVDTHSTLDRKSKIENPVTRKFKSCRYYETQDNGGTAYCSNRDVLPYAGINGFKPEAWCEDCSFYKVRRTVKKPEDH